MPDPGDVLVERVAGTTDRAWFYDSGRDSVGELERTLALVGRSLDSFESILDFGCGCGRMLLWLEDLGTRRELHGADVDAQAIAWAADHIPYCRFTVTQPDPPLPYADGSFDLVFNHSVFTHIDEHRQDAWLTELQRVTRPGGLLVLSVHAIWGEEGSDVHTRLEDDGHLFLPEIRPRSELDHPDWYAAAFHAPWYVFEHWGRWFVIRAYLPKAALGLQDHVLLERTADAERLRPLAARPRRAPRDAIEQQVRAVHAQIGVGPARFGPLGAGLRRAVLRLLRPHTLHAANADILLARSIDELASAAEAQARQQDVGKLRN
jgi:SAM-dependent methyltransferase